MDKFFLTSGLKVSIAKTIVYYSWNFFSSIKGLMNNFLGFMEVGAGVVQGIKRSTTAAITSLTGSCLLRVVWLLTVFKINPTLEYIFITFPLSWVVTAVAHFIVANVILKREAKNKNSLLADNIN